jgi:hypothetical protein
MRTGDRRNPLIAGEPIIDTYKAFAAAGTSAGYDDPPIFNRAFSGSIRFLPNKWNSEMAVNA